MPTYDFVCPARHEFERFFRKISEAPTEMPCPECGAIAVRKVSGGAGLLFKGSGFYITDYGKDGKKPQTPPKTEESAPTATSSDATATPTGETKKSNKRSESSGPKSSSSGGSSGE